VKRVDAWTALSLLPRFTLDKRRKKGPDDGWFQNAERVMLNHALCPPELVKVAKRFMMTDVVCSFETVDVSNAKVLVLHRSLTWSHLVWLFKRNFSWNKWPKSKLPCLIRYKGKYIVWNGTHRFTLCRLLNRKLRCKVWEMDEWVKAKMK
jgi:hypothetical protein